MISRLVLALAVARGALAYTWPSPKLDRLEALRWDQLGYNSFEAALFVTPCDRYIHPQDPGYKGVRSNAGDWIRTAYHDMAPHNKEDGTGGMDSSIRMWEEQARAENPGTHFNNSVGFVAGAVDRHFSLADGLALLLVMAVENCGGPEVDFRGGRIDATEPNAAGVPEPDQDLDSHEAAFARQGFTPEEMIGLVACGHSIGSVQHADFPDQVPASPDGEDVIAGVAFDGTLVEFDNTIATEYIEGTTQNPLVVGLNDTKNSDGRIFSLDGNKTMAAFAKDADHFASTCASLFARMIDTVPKGVELTEVIRPLPAKPSELKLTYTKSGNITLSGEVRLFDIAENDARTVQIAWTDATCTDGADCPVHRARMPHTANMTGSAQAKRYTSLWYGSAPPLKDIVGGTAGLASIDPAAGFGAFWFEADEGDGKAVAYDQDGARFALPTDRVMRAEGTCEKTVNVAVHESVKPTRVYIAGDAFTADNQGQAPAREFDLKAGGAADANGYVIWTAELEAMPSFSYGILAEADGKTIELPQNERSDFC
ncbi:heme peroxidase [Schizophyllum fasciatum]